MLLDMSWVVASGGCGLLSNGGGAGAGAGAGAGPGPGGGGGTVEELLVAVEVADEADVKTWVRSEEVRCCSGETTDLILEISSCRMFHALGMSALMEERTRASWRSCWRSWC